MKGKILETRILLMSDTSIAWENSSKVILKGEVAIEFQENEQCGIKIGDGIHTFKELPYATLSQEKIKLLIQESLNSFSGSIHTHTNKVILDAIKIAFTEEMKNDYDVAYAHSQTTHAPVDAEHNKIIAINVNGVESIPNELRTVNISVPVGSDEILVENNAIKVKKLDTSKLSGFIKGDQIQGLDASKLTSGTIPIARLPKAALDNLVKVNNDSDRFLLTTENIQNGDSVFVINTKKMYLVVDDTKLSSEDGYQEYSSGKAASIDWSGIENKPEIMVGATDTSNGFGGLIPQPNAGDNHSFLKGNGSFQRITASDINTTEEAQFVSKISINKWDAKQDKLDIATSDSIGLVKSSDVVNEVLVSSDGKMKLNGITTDLLSKGTLTLVLNGGGA